MKADTHIHSVFSDGTYTPDVITKIAKEENMDLIALTDHNTVEGNKVFSECAKECGLKVLAGSEITTEFRGREIHLLSYFPIDTDFADPRFEELNKILEKNRQNKIDAKRKTIENISVDFPNVSFDDFMKYVEGHSQGFKDISRGMVAEYLVYKGLAANKKKASDDILMKGGKYHVSAERGQLSDILKTVVGCGGFPAIAHLIKYQPQLSDDDLRDMLTMVSGITRSFGVEIFHFKHRQEDIERYIALCDSIDADILFMAGSDCHGLRKPNMIGHPYNFELDEHYSSLYQEISENVVGFFEEKNWI